MATVAGSLVLLAGGPVLAAPREPVPGLPVYLALGDSWAYGQGSTDPASDGYVPQLLASLRGGLHCLPASSAKAAGGCGQLQLVNLGRPATATMPGVTAKAVAEEQLPVALPMLQARNGDRNPRNDVEVLTLHVGGNDVSRPIVERCLVGGLTPEQCLEDVIPGVLAGFKVEFDSLLSRLREGAGGDARIVVGTYGNPIPFCVLGRTSGAAELAEIVLEGSVGPVQVLGEGLHDIIRKVAADHGADVAEVFTALGDGDFVGGADCLHPNDSGYDKVTSAFEQAIFG
jgi:lysophospholipase L1-like esterase